METVEHYVGRIAGNSSATFTAGSGAGEVSGFGRWGAHLYRGDSWDSRGSWGNIDFNYPASRIDVSPTGHLQFVLADRAGWKPFLILVGAEPGREIRAGITFSVNMPDDYPGYAPLMNWDPVRSTYEVIGPTSDGSSGAIGRPLIVQLQIMDGSSLGFAKAVLGWTQFEIPEIQGDA